MVLRGLAHRRVAPWVLALAACAGEERIGEREGALEGMTGEVACPDDLVDKGDPFLSCFRSNAGTAVEAEIGDSCFRDESMCPIGSVCAPDPTYAGIDGETPGVWRCQWPFGTMLAPPPRDDTPLAVAWAADVTDDAANDRAIEDAIWDWMSTRPDLYEDPRCPPPTDFGTIDSPRRRWYAWAFSQPSGAGFVDICSEMDLDGWPWSLGPASGAPIATVVDFPGENLSSPGGFAQIVEDGTVLRYDVSCDCQVTEQHGVGYVDPYGVTLVETYSAITFNYCQDPSWIDVDGRGIGGVHLRDMLGWGASHIQRKLYLCDEVTPPPAETPPPDGTYFEEVPGATDPPPSTGCGSETESGRCDGDVLVWCEGTTVERFDCAVMAKSCGWVDDTHGHNCLPFTIPVPAPDAGTETTDAPDAGAPETPPDAGAPETPPDADPPADADTGDTRRDAAPHPSSTT